MNPTPEPGAGPRGAEPLAQALRRAAQVLDNQQPPPALREALLRRLQPLPAAPPPRRWWALTAWSGGAAVVAMLALGSAVLLLVPPPEPAPRAGAPAEGRDFVPLVPRDEWPQEASAAWLVASELPPERLAALGLPYDPSRAARPVRAELLVIPSGQVLALRLVD